MTEAETPTAPENLFSIPMDAWEEFQEKLAKMNKRASKLGCDPITLEHLGEHDVERTRVWTVVTEDGKVERSRTYKLKAKVVLIHGKAPRVEGFEFVARIEYLSDGKSTLFHQVPGATAKIDERFRTLKPFVCEHCNKIRSRTETFVVLEVATGKQSQVGRQCLADFTGINTPEKLAAKMSSLWSYSDFREFEEGAWRTHFANTIDTLWVLQLTSAYIERFGWVPKSASSETQRATAYHVLEHFHGRPADPREGAFQRQMEELAGQEKHVERAVAAHTWVKVELAAKAKSDYEMNLVTLVSGELAETKHLGIVCSAVSTWQRATDQQVEYAKKREALKASQHLEGVIGKRLKGLACTVQTVRALEPGEWGPKTMVKFLTADGNLLTWFASGDRDYNVGEEVRIDGTIKQFKEYQGIKETQMTRVKVHEGGT